MARPIFPCPHCGAAKQAVNGLCGKCGRFGTAKGYCPGCASKLPRHDRGCLTSTKAAPIAPADAR